MFQTPTEKKTKEILFGKELQKKLFDGASRLSDIVGSTLGPFGRNVIIKQNKMKSFITKDGVSVARNVSFGNTFENLAAEIIKQAAESTVLSAGDGTTTATILAFEIFANALKFLEEHPNHSRSQLAQEMAETAQKIKSFLKENAKQVDSLDLVEQVAKVSANGDETIAKLIRNAIEQIGKDGSISIQMSQSNQTFLEVSEGFRIDSGIFARDLVTDVNKQICKFSNCLVFITDQVISQAETITPVLEIAMRDGKPLVIVAGDVKDQALALILLTHLRRDHPITIIKAPRYGTERLDLLDDLALRVNAKFFSQQSGKMIKTLQLADFGQCETFEATRTNSTFVARNGNQELIQQRMNALRDRIKDKATPINEAKFLQERLTKLASGIAIIKVGGLTDAEVVEKLHRIEDALEAVNSARKGGILPGGGVALLRFFHYAENASNGEKIVRHCLCSPLSKLLENKGEDEQTENISVKILEHHDFWFGYDVSKGEFGNLLEMGIIDPYLVVSSALENAVSAAGILLTTDSAILEYEV